MKWESKAKVGWSMHFQTLIKNGIFSVFAFQVYIFKKFILVPVSRIADLSAKSAEMHIFRLFRYGMSARFVFQRYEKMTYYFGKIRIFFPSTENTWCHWNTKINWNFWFQTLIIKYEMSPTFVFRQYITRLILAKFIFLSLDQK